MNNKKTNIFLHIVNIITVALVIESFLCAIMIVYKYSEEGLSQDAFYDKTHTVLGTLAIFVVVLMFIHVAALMLQDIKNRKNDDDRMHRSDYINAVQRELINAHNDRNFVGQALKTVGNELEAETVLLLTVDGMSIVGAYYWPSVDKAQAMELVGRNIRDEFPVIFDMISACKSVNYTRSEDMENLSDNAKALFEALDVRNIMLVPIMNNFGVLKGVIASVNLKSPKESCELLECVTYDFFMAITNLENHNIIKKMGTMDYLTSIKNRNSYEQEITQYAMADGETLWCAYIDVNGLHELNNKEGHKAGDTMLCKVADAVKKVFGEENSYRLGGDEFAAFAVDSTKEEFLKKKKTVIAKLASKGYHISIGFEAITKNADGVFEIEKLVSAAESNMYKNKREYYEENNLSQERVKG